MDAKNINELRKTVKGNEEYGSLLQQTRAILD